MKPTRPNTAPLSEDEWDTCWMAIRYAMNRMTISSASLPNELLSAYYSRWTPRQKEMIVRELRDNLENLKSWNESEEAYFGDKNIDHPNWMRFLLTLDESTHKILTLKRRKKVEAIEFEGVYYPVSDGGWWAGCGALYVPKDAIVLIEGELPTNL